MSVRAMEDCIFCNAPSERLIFESEFAYALWDGFPVSWLHCLVLPRRHVRDYFSLTEHELLECNNLLHRARELIETRDQTVEGFNIGANVGTAGGQTIFHCHLHLIPRRRGDVENPRGGVRHIIPGKGAY